jgi:predicted aldo/keto reductase-like oxidoreductase
MSKERAHSMAGSAIEKAKTCLECGACITRCPYKLEIPKLLKERIADWDRVYTQAG